jgi:hypothetical protein
MQPHYYLMRNKKILRLEAEMKFSSLPLSVQEQVLDCEAQAMDQNQANWRVVIFRDEILEVSEYLDWHSTPEAQTPGDQEIEYIAN